MQNTGLYDYAWFTSLGEFNVGLDRLVDMFDGPNKPTAALMCCEAVWWRCHRSMIADVLAVRGVEVRHLPRWQDHLDSDIRNRIERYPEAVRASWHGVTPETVIQQSPSNKGLDGGAPGVIPSVSTPSAGVEGEPRDAHSNQDG